MFRVTLQKLAADLAANKLSYRQMDSLPLDAESIVAGGIPFLSALLQVQPDKLEMNCNQISLERLRQEVLFLFQVIGPEKFNIESSHVEKRVNELFGQLRQRINQNPKSNVQANAGGSENKDPLPEVQTQFDKKSKEIEGVYSRLDQMLQPVVCNSWEPQQKFGKNNNLQIIWKKERNKLSIHVTEDGKPLGLYKDPSNKQVSFEFRDSTSTRWFVRGHGLGGYIRRCLEFTYEDYVIHRSRFEDTDVKAWINFTKLVAPGQPAVTTSFGQKLHVVAHFDDLPKIFSIVYEAAREFGLETFKVVAIDDWENFINNPVQGGKIITLYLKEKQIQDLKVLSAFIYKLADAFMQRGLRTSGFSNPSDTFIPGTGNLLTTRNDEGFALFRIENTHPPGTTDPRPVVHFVTLLDDQNIQQVCEKFANSEEPLLVQRAYLKYLDDKNVDIKVTNFCPYLRTQLQCRFAPNIELTERVNALHVISPPLGNTRGNAGGIVSAPQNWLKLSQMFERPLNFLPFKQKLVDAGVLSSAPNDSYQMMEQKLVSSTTADFTQRIVQERILELRKQIANLQPSPEVKKETINPSAATTGATSPSKTEPDNKSEPNPKSGCCSIT